MEKEKCKFCKFWKIDNDPPSHFIGGFSVGLCNEKAEDNFDLRDMKNNQVAVICGHDGGVFFGENFGCIHFERK